MRFRLILFAAITLICAGHVDAGVTSQGIMGNSLTKRLGLAAQADGRRPCDDGGLGIRAKCCDESQIGCRNIKRGVTWIELSPIFGEPVRVNGVRVGPRETTFFGTLQLDQNEIIIGTSTSYVIDTFATIAPDPSLTPRIPASKRFFNPYCFDVFNDLTPVPIEIPKFDTSVPIKSEPSSPPQVPSSKSSYDPFRFDQR
jgi:hypothetical protein